MDLASDPPPDLVIEVDITRDSIDTLAIYAAIGVLEIWRFDGASLSIFRFMGDSYAEADRSTVIPILPRPVIEDFTNMSKGLSRTAWLKGASAMGDGP